MYSRGSKRRFVKKLQISAMAFKMSISRSGFWKIDLLTHKSTLFDVLMAISVLLTSKKGTNLQFLEKSTCEYILWFFYYYILVPDVWKPPYTQIQGQRENFKFYQKSTCRSSSIHSRNFLLPDSCLGGLKPPKWWFWVIFILFFGKFSVFF